MIPFLDKFIWSGLLALGIQFLYIGYRVRFERAYGFFGASMVLLALVFLGEARPMPFLANVGSIQAWAYFSLVLSCIFSPLILRFIFEVNEFYQPRSFRFFWIATAGLASLCLGDFFWDRSLIYPASGRPLAISPLLGGVIFSIGVFWLTLMGRSFWNSLGQGSLLGKKSLLGLAFGVVVFTAGGILDWLSLTQAWEWKGFGLEGAGIFAGTGVYFLLHRFFALHRANKNTLEKLAIAYAGLGESAKLKALGASTASITHEIRNFAATLKGNAVLMGRGLVDEEYRQEVNRIKVTAERMESIAKDVAVYARATLPMVSQPLDLEKLLHRCISHWFPLQAEKINVQAMPPQVSLLGDEAGLDQVFVNLLKNSLEAGAHKVDIRFRILGQKLITVIDDDGLGCDYAELDQITKPFYSNKGSAGTGLGCSIAESILKSHGASLRYYAKNALSEGQTGMVLNLVFPLAGNAPDVQSRLDLSVFCLDNPSRNDLVQTMMHLGIHPLLLPTHEAFIKAWEPENDQPIFLDRSMAYRWPAFKKKPQAICVGLNRTAMVMGVDGKDEGVLFLFTEERLAMLVEGMALI